MPSRRLQRWLLLFYATFLKHTSESAVISPNCGGDIDDEHQARRCYNLANRTDLAPPPLPVVLESTTENGFICKNKSTLYSFSCKAHASDMVWYINNEIVTAFLPFDTVGTIFRSSYPALAPIYSVTTILMEQTSMSFGGYRLPVVSSTLTIQSFNESQNEVISFTVSCQAHCEDENYTEVCQSRQVNVAAKPMKPTNVYGSIHVDNNISLSSLNWDSPQNRNETDIRFYDINLLRNHSDDGMSIHVAASKQTLSYKYALSSSGNYTQASITAVDLCGQRSEASEFQLMPVADGSITDGESSDRYRQMVDILAGVLAVAISIIIVQFIIFVCIIICITLNRQGAKKSGIASAEHGNCCSTISATNLVELVRYDAD